MGTESIYCDWVRLSFADSTSFGSEEMTLNRATILFLNFTSSSMRFRGFHGLRDSVSVIQLARESRRSEPSPGISDIDHLVPMTAVMTFASSVSSISNQRERETVFECSDLVQVSIFSLNSLSQQREVQSQHMLLAWCICKGVSSDSSRQLISRKLSGAVRRFWYLNTWLQLSDEQAAPKRKLMNYRVMAGCFRQPPREMKAFDFSRYIPIHGRRRRMINVRPCWVVNLLMSLAPRSERCPAYHMIHRIIQINTSSASDISLILQMHIRMHRNVFLYV